MTDELAIFYQNPRLRGQTKYIYFRNREYQYTKPSVTRRVPEILSVDIAEIRKR